MTQLPPEPEDWRGKAEAILGARGEDPREGEALRLVHELRVHQIELELQNEALREAQMAAEAGWERFQELYDFAPVGYFSLDGQGLIQQVNFAGARLLGAERGLLISRPFAKFIATGDRERFAEFLRAGRDTLGHPPCEVAILSETPLKIRLEAALSADGMLTRLVAMDITQLRLAQEQVNILNRDLERRVETRTAQLKAANADLEGFCYMISHELRAPLARMEGFSRMLQDPGAQGPASLLHIAQRIEASSHDLRTVVDSLLRMTRISLDQLEPEPVDLSLTVLELLKDLDSPDRPIHAKVAEGVVARCDRRLMTICLRNLLENAIKFSSKVEDAEVEFGVADREGTPVHFIRDNGAGFDPALSGKLFQAFVRLHRQEDFPGTGVGLSIVQRIIEKHGGRVWVESSPGAGAKFLFTLGL